MNLLPIRLILLCGLLVFLHPLQGHAAKKESPEIKDIIVTTSDKDLLLFATVNNGFTSQMLDDLRTGTPIVFTYHLELVKTNNNWIDTTMVETTVSHTMTFDSEKKEYRITFSDQDKRVVTTDDPEQAQQLMTELNGVKIIALTQLIPDAPYAIHFKVTLKKGRLPFGINRLIPFASLWDFETAWRTIEFRY
jgi:hypothetical protein